MADRTSARIFGMVFEYLAKDPSIEGVEMAEYMWKESRNYDFSPYQMYCDDALITLGLATEIYDDEVEQEIVIYKGDERWSGNNG